MAQAQTRKSTNLSLDRGLLTEAKKLNVNLSRAAEAGIRMAVMQFRTEIWKSENQNAMESSNEFVERHGMPLGRLRQF